MSRGGLSRADAARLLREACHARGSARAELAGWACLAMPRRLPARRLYIEALIDAGDCDQADALIAQSLLQRPSSAALTLLRARSLHRQGRLQEADREAALALTRRPRHGPTLALAGTIARARGRAEQALTLFERAALLRPDDARRRERHARALVEAGRTAEARQVAVSLLSVPPLLEVRLLRAEGRLLEAAELLAARWPIEPAPRRRDRLLAALLTILDEMGDAEAIRRLVGVMPARACRARTQAAGALLALGDTRAAVRLARSALRNRRTRRRALHVLVAAASLAGDRRGAAAALARLHGSPRGVSPRLMAACWRRGLLGCRLAAAVATDCRASVLGPLVRRSAATLEAARPGGDHIAACRGWLRRHTPATP